MDIKPPYGYKTKLLKGLPPLKSAERDKIIGVVPEKVDKYPVVAQIPRLPPLPSIEEQEGYHVTVTWFDNHCATPNDHQLNVC